MKTQGRNISNFSRRSFLKSLGAVGAALSFSGCGSSFKFPTESSKKPNIVFIMADDHATNAMSCYGSKLNSTPNIDRLASEGVRFTNCFNVSSLCAPSRAALITGKYNHVIGFKLYTDVLDRDQMTFSKLLKTGGYETAIVGKWHLGTEPSGFDYYKVLPEQGRYFDCPMKEKGQPWEDGRSGGIVNQGYVTDVITDSSIEWLENRDSTQPFCLMVHHKAPHTPHHYPERYEKLFSEDDLTKPDTFDDTFEGKNSALVNDKCGYSKLSNAYPNHFNKKVPSGCVGEDYKEWGYQTFFKGYLRLVAALDENVGRLLDYLDKSGLSDNTLVVYTSDNGFFLGDHGLFNKMWMYEESLHIPLLVRYPNEIKAGAVNRELVSILDFAPTFLDYASVEIPSEFQGMSIRPLLQGKKLKNWRSAHYYRFYEQVEVPAHYGIRTKRYKLLYFDNTDEWEFYDLEKDPSEMQNCYNSRQYTKVIGGLKKELVELRVKYKASEKTQ